MLALLGLLAVAGFQNRDKIAAALNNLGGGASGGGTSGGGATGQGGGLGGLLGGIENAVTGASGAASGAAAGAGAAGGLGEILSGLGSGGTVTGGLGDLMNSFRDAGHGAVAVTPGVPTQGLTPQQVEQAVGADNLDRLTQATGLSKDELLKRLATAIPQTVDTLTPGGNMPTEQEARKNLGLPS